jgi:hypothetical protein
MNGKQLARVVFYQNDRTGKFVTHKEKFRPTEQELRSLIDELVCDTGVLGLMDNDVTRVYEFTKSGIIHEADPDDGKKTVERQHIIDMYYTRSP